MANNYFNANDIKVGFAFNLELANGLAVTMNKMKGGALKATTMFNGEALEAEHNAKDMRLKLAEWEKLGHAPSENKSGLIVAYVRVSSVSQNTARQDFKGYSVDKTYTEKASAKDANRPELQKMLSELQKGDTVLVHSIDRLARSQSDLRNLVEQMIDLGVSIRFIKEGLIFSADKSAPTTVLMLNLLGAVSEFERTIIRERQAEGIAKAKEKGIYKGRPANVRLRSMIKAMLAEGKSIRAIAAELACSTQTVQRVKKEMLAKNNDDEQQSLAI